MKSFFEDVREIRKMMKILKITQNLELVDAIQKKLNFMEDEPVQNEHEIRIRGHMFRILRRQLARILIH
jgi:hypothetical protein